MSKLLAVDLDNILSGNHGYDTLLEPELTMECMQVTISHYMTLSRIIDRKFGHALKALKNGHALKALKKRIAEIEAEQSAALKAAAQNPDQAAVQKLRKYKALGVAFQKLKDVLSMAQLNVDELERINDVFGLLPGKIKVYYDHLVLVDQELLEMINEISGDDYRTLYERAQRITDLVQGGKDALTGKMVVDVKAPGPSIKEVLDPLEEEMLKMGGKREGYEVLADGRLVRDL